MQSLTLVQQVSVIILPLVLAVTVHEAAHGWVADRCGDNTARALGRVTFNPIPHIDPIGTIVLPLGLFVLSSLAGGGFLFGWAKPVPVNMHRLRRPRRDMALVALAGPGANLLMACFWGAVTVLGNNLETTFNSASNFLLYMSLFGILINAMLLVLNLLPILPLDGGRVLAALLPVSLAQKYAKLEPWGLVILIALIMSGLLGPFIMPLIFGLRSGILRLFGLP